MYVGIAVVIHLIQHMVYSLQLHQGYMYVGNSVTFFLLLATYKTICICRCSVAECGDSTAKSVYIRESVDSLCRDGTDTPIKP